MPIVLDASVNKITGVAGQVMQVVQATTTTGTSVSAGTISASNLTASITPISSSNKILVLASGQLYTAGGTGGGLFLYRNGSLVFSPSSIDATNKVYQFYNISYQSATINYLDSPATTSSTTYTVYFSCYTGTATFPYASAGQSNATAVIQLLEIAG